MYRTLSLLVLLIILGACARQNELITTPQDPNQPLFTATDLQKATQVRTLESKLIQGRTLDWNLKESEVSGEGNVGGDFTPQTVIAGVNGWVVYIRSNGTTHQIWRHDQTNDARLQVFSGTNLIDSVAITLDGNRVFASVFNPGTNSKDIYEFVISPASTNQLTNTSSDETNVSVNAFGNVVVWQGNNAGLQAPFTCTYVANTCSTTVLNNTTNHVQPSVSSNGAYIAMIEEQTTGNDRVRLYNRNTSTYLTALSSSIPLEHPSVSDDGINIMYLQHDTTASVDRIKIKNLATGVTTTERSITNPQFIDHPHITADGLYLAYGVESSSTSKLVAKTRDIALNSEGSTSNSSYDHFGTFWQKPIPSFANNRIYVDKDATTGLSNGRSWANAFIKLQDALRYARTAGYPFTYEIWVADGVYYPDEGIFQINNSEADSFNLVNSVALYGGFNGTETALSQRNITTNVTILSGDITQDDTNTDNNKIAETTADIIGDNSDHVIYNINITSTDTRLDGFTVTAGQADAGNIDGAGMYNDNSSPTITNSTFSGNIANDDGGAIHNSTSSPTISYSTFSGNTAILSGGAIYNRSSSPPISNSTFVGNTAGYEGGAIYNDTSSPAISYSTFSGNTSNESGGGAIYNRSSSPPISNSTFSSNTTNWRGGAIENENSSPIISYSNFIDNTAVADGGAIANTGTSYPIINNVTFSNNSALDAEGKGGAIYNSTSSSSFRSNISNSTFTDNNAYYGAAIYNTGSHPIIDTVTFESNHAGFNGGAIYNWISNPSINNSIFHQNFADNAGGAIYNETSSPSITRNSFLGNGAGIYGGSLYILNGNITVSNSIFSGDFSFFGGAIANINNSPTNYTLTLSSVSFSRNSAAGNGGAIYNEKINSGTLTVDIKNSILWDDKANGIDNEIYNLAGTVIFSYSDIKAGWNGAGVVNVSGTSSNGGGNRQAIPRFIDANGADNVYGTLDDNLRLKDSGYSPSSALIDAGNSDLLIGITTDRDGNDRFKNEPNIANTGVNTTQDSVVDMGAYED